MKKFRTFFYLIVAIMHLFGCANRVTPTGGIKDVLPPKLLLAEPADKSLNFNSKTIVLTFNEYIQLKDQSKQITISPVITPAPVIGIKKKSVVIELGNNLAANTTYTINFGNAIADVHEGNVLNSFRYVFSTGSFIDSLMVNGTVADALTKKPIQGATVILYNAKTADSLLLNKTPDYFSRTDSMGNYKIFNVREDDYKVFALVDKNNNYKYDQPDEAVGFVEENILLKDSVTKNMVTFLQKPQKQNIKSSTIVEPGKLLTVFARPVENISWNFLTSKFDSVKVEYNTFRDSILFYCFPAVADTMSVIWLENGVVVDTVKYQKQRSGGIEQKAKFTGYTFYPAKANNLAPETQPQIKWWAPIAQIDSTKIIFSKDSVVIPVKMQFTDSLNTNLILRGNWSEGSYNVSILPQAVTDLYGFKNDSIKTNFTFPLAKTKGSISFNVMTLEPGNHILQLVNEKDEPVRERIFEQRIAGVFELVDPGKYRMRIISDTNSNNRWDAGNFKQQLVAEDVKYYNETIVVRANWEVETEWVR